MIRFLHHDQIDKSRWDDCIGLAINGNLYAYSWYLDIVSPGWCALVEDDYETVFPLTVSSRMGVGYIMQPYFTQQLGLYFRCMPQDEKLTEFIHFIPERYGYIDINLNSSNRIPAGIHAFDNINLELSLRPDYNTIAKAYQANLQRNLKKAGQNKLSLSKTVSPDEVISLFRANRGKELRHLGHGEYALVNSIACESIQKGTGEIWGALDEHKQLVAGILWVRSHQKAIFLFSALSERGKKLNAMPWLIDTFISENSGKPVTLDFEGSNNEGLARFYSSFGATSVVYQRFVRNTLSLPLRIALKIRRLNLTRLKNIFPLLKR
ncbi:MAG: hypothetical protein WCR72_17025 [Bacteroidota bacterium]